MTIQKTVCLCSSGAPECIPVSFSTFAERHSSWWFNCGFNELYNVGKRGSESAEDVTPHVLDWIERNGEKDNWFMHVHFWDPHTPYRAPASFGNPFADEPLPDNWIDDKIFAEHLMHIGRTAQTRSTCGTTTQTPPGRVTREDSKPWRI